MKTKSTLSHLLTVTVLVAALFCTAAKAEEDEVFDLNSIVVKGELYVWNRISDALDIFRCGIAGGGDLGFDIALTEYAQLGAMVTKERGVDFPHFIPPFWLAHYYQRKPIFNTHEGYCLTTAFGPKRNEVRDPEEGNVTFGRSKWDIRLEAAVLVHVYLNVSASELGDFFAGFVGWDPSDDDQVLGEGAIRRPADQFGRGLANILFGIVEIPKNVCRVTEEEGDLAGATKGVGLGIWRFAVREVVGVVEFVTFPFGWAPMIEPEYPIQNTPNGYWTVKRPAFHRRY